MYRNDGHPPSFLLFEDVMSRQSYNQGRTIATLACALK